MNMQRFVVIKEFFGRSDMCSKDTICTCCDLQDAAEIIDALVLLYSGRCFVFKAKKIADDYIPELDDEIRVNFFTGEEKDLCPYIKGISCL